MRLGGETFRVALGSIQANKLRSALTMLGIIIGVGAVIAVVALGTGAQKEVEDRINAMGANVLSVFPAQQFGRGRAGEDRAALTLDDYEALMSGRRLISTVVPEMNANKSVQLGRFNANLNILATTAEFVPVKNYKLVPLPNSRMFTAGEDASRQRYAILGNSVPTMMNQNPAGLIGRTLMIAGQPFEILGVFEKKGAAASWGNPDEQVIIPLNTGRYRLFGIERLNNMSVQVKDGIPLEQGMVEIEQILRRRHKIRPAGENNFNIANRRDLLSTQQETTQIFTYLLGSIALVSLAVGGIGIMNIMLVSVTERTREIGIRRALGATKINIMSQFLTEAIVLCLLGGAFGVLVGAGAAVSARKFLGWSTLVSMPAVILAFFFSAAVGLFFGLWPAQRAANLNTIDALRYE